jgi:multidrug efflux pump subunit AcrA (membrane-fusion protein)
MLHHVRRPGDSGRRARCLRPTRGPSTQTLNCYPMTDQRPLHRRASLPFFAAALLLTFTVAGCAKKQERAPRPTATVSVAPVRRANVPYVIEANGVVTPLQSVAVTPQVDGLITSVDFQEGQEVRAGQPLFHVDARPYENAYNQALAVLARDSAMWANAQANADRYRKLLEAKVITPEEGGQQLTSAATADATVRADRAAAAQAKFNLDNTVIRAPIGGKTGTLLVKQGNLVRAGSGTALVVINQVRPILVRFAIPSSQLALVLQYGDKGGLPVAAVPGGVAPASPSIDSMAAEAMNPVDDPPGQSAADGSGAGSAAGSTTGPGPNAGRGSRGANGAPGGGVANGGLASTVQQQGAFTGDRLMGTLSMIDNAVDTTTGTVQLRAKFDNSNGRLWAGQFASTSLHLFDEDSVLVVPTQAIVTGQRGAYVYVIDPSDTARQRAVTVERTAGNLAIIANGVREGDRVVTDGQSRLSPDMAVRLRGASDAGPGSVGADGARGPRGKGGKGGKGGRGKRGG